MQKIDHNNGFREKANCFAETCQKSQKIVITTSTPDVGFVVVTSAAGP
jgi:hypothetical protein